MDKINCTRQIVSIAFLLFCYTNTIGLHSKVLWEGCYFHNIPYKIYFQNPELYSHDTIQFFFSMLVLKWCHIESQCFYLKIPCHILFISIDVMDVTSVKYSHVKMSSITSDYFVMDSSLILGMNCFLNLPHVIWWINIRSQWIQCNMRAIWNIRKNHFILRKMSRPLYNLIFILNQFDSCILPTLIVVRKRSSYFISCANIIIINSRKL